MPTKEPNLPEDISKWTRADHYAWMQYIEQWKLENNPPSTVAAKTLPPGREWCMRCGGTGLLWTVYYPAEYPDRTTCPRCDESGMEPLDW